MTEEQKQKLVAMSTLKERATFLLELGVSSAITIVNLTPVAQACIGDVRLPCFGSSEEEAIHRGTIYLKDKAEQRLTAKETSILEKMDAEEKVNK
jgi:hypothetical protein